MGCFPKLSTSTECAYPPVSRPEGNPNPYNFSIVDSVCLGSDKTGWLWVVRVNYPDCVNYEGDKVIVMKKDSHQLSALDPHFTESGYVVARFAPSTFGMDMARMFALACLANNL